MSAQERVRFPRSVYGIGDDPDPRFSLANERTFLAWISTGLGLLAAGVALETFAIDLQPALRLAASILLIVAGIATPIQAWLGWMRTERAMRLSLPLPSPRLALPLVIIIAVAGALVIAATVLAR